MITTTDIANILYRDCQPFGIGIVPHGKKLAGALKSEKIGHPRQEAAAG